VAVVDAGRIVEIGRAREVLRDAIVSA